MPNLHKILIVDDEPLLKSIILQKFKNEVKNKELSFIFAAHGVEALEKLKEDDEIGVVFTDLNMPEMDGLTLLGHLVSQNRLYRTVVISAYSDFSNIRTAMNRGASDFITKPIDLDDLEITIKKTIEQYVAIREGVAAQKQVIEFQSELKIASDIQQAFIPHGFNPYPGNKNLTLFGEMIPAKEVGGDFFDFFPLDQEHLGIVIADVAGKGIPAALFMAMSRVLIRATASISTSTSECMRQVNRLLSADNDPVMFVTAFYAILNINTGELQYCNAGHNYPYIVESDGTFKEIGRNEGIALGASDNLELASSLYSEKTVQLKKDDSLILYTDGVTEAENPEGELYNNSRLEQSLKNTGGKSLPEIIQTVKQDLKTFVVNAKQSDDITLFGVRFNGQS